jgi:2-polyprenyl-3-methyl-5-hydroxy-6-metoxy-1,4-benzoquinol methylase
MTEPRSETAGWYDRNAVRYARTTDAIDASKDRTTFLDAVEASRGERIEPARILDVGCGGGRDLRTFVSEGLAAEGLDPCEKLAVIAAENSGASAQPRR